MIIFFLISIFLMSLTWPHILTGNFEVFLDGILQSISWSSGPQLGIIGGNFYETSNTPRIYLLHFFIFRLPIYLIMLLVTTIVILKINNQFFVQQIKNYKTSLNIVLFTIFFPIIIALFFKVKIYDGIRLFLFLIPLLSLFAAMGLYYLFKNIYKSIYLKITFVIIFIFFILALSRFIYLTPYQYTYSNFFNPKFSYTQNLYEHDYWATSFKELISKVKQSENLSNKKFSVSICGGDFWQIVSEFSKDKTFSKNITFYDYSMADKADYIIMTNRSSFITKNKTTCYSIFSGKDITSVNRLGVDLSVFRELTK